MTKQQRRGFLHGLVPLLFVLICGYLFLTLIQCQVSISSKQQELASVQTQLSAKLADNAALSRTLSEGEDAILERAAREQGYVKPNERVFIDISGK